MTTPYPLYYTQRLDLQLICYSIDLFIPFWLHSNYDLVN